MIKIVNTKTTEWTVNRSIRTKNEMTLRVIAANGVQLNNVKEE